MTTDKPLSYSFAPIIGTQAKVLILGTMPSVASLEKQQYYGHARNAFWPIMANLFEFDVKVDYSLRCEALIENHIAVFDVLKACYRPGSLDQDIDPSTTQVNDFNALLKQYPTIQHILFNGGKAEQLFKRYALNTLTASQTDRITLQRLPSTSPAHAAMSLQKKRAEWARFLTLSD